MVKQLAPYPEKLANCMVNYQYLEEGLRFCLYRCQTFIHLRVSSALAYEAPLKSIDEAAMPRLIELFKPFSRNESLIQKLRLVNNHRDSLAHEGGLIQTGDQTPENEKALEAFLMAAEECTALLREESTYIDEQVRQEFQRLKQDKALPDIDIIPPL